MSSGIVVVVVNDVYSCIVIIHLLLHSKTVFYYAEGGPNVSERSIYFLNIWTWESKYFEIYGRGGGGGTKKGRAKFVVTGPLSHERVPIFPRQDILSLHGDQGMSQNFCCYPI